VVLGVELAEPLNPGPASIEVVETGDCQQMPVYYRVMEKTYALAILQITVSVEKAAVEWKSAE
jgi:hypothetical protein